MLVWKIGSKKIIQYQSQHRKLLMTWLDVQGNYLLIWESDNALPVPRKNVISEVALTLSRLIHYDSILCFVIVWPLLVCCMTAPPRTSTPKAMDFRNNWYEPNYKTHISSCTNKRRPDITGHNQRNCPRRFNNCIWWMARIYWYWPAQLPASDRQPQHEFCWSQYR